MLESNASSPRSKRKLNQGVWQLGMIEDLISWKVELIYSSQGTFKAHHYFNYILLSENWSIFLRILWSRYMIVSMFNLPINFYSKLLYLLQILDWKKYDSITHKKDCNYFCICFWHSQDISSFQNVEWGLFTRNDNIVYTQ